MRKIISVALLAVGIALVPLSVSAVTPDLVGNACSVDPNSPLCTSKDESVESFIKKLSNTLLWAVGILAVIMIIFGGIKYITSAGDASKLTSAKNTILYSVVGLVVAIFSYAIVTWVDTEMKKASSPPSGSQTTNP